MAETYYATADTWVGSADPSATHGGATMLYFGADGASDSFSTFVKWGTIIPTGKYFVYGDIRFYGPIGGQEEGTYKIWKINNTWTEGAVTWDNRWDYMGGSPTSKELVGYMMSYQIENLPDYIGDFLNYGIAIGKEDMVTSEVYSSEYGGDPIITPALSLYITEDTTLNSVSYSNPDSNSVTLNWDILDYSDDPYFTRYEFWRATSSGGVYSKISGADITNRTSYSTSTTQTNGSKQWYKIKCVYTSHSVEKSHDLSTVTAQYCVVKKRPQNLTATGQNKQAYLTWTDLAEADHYHIYHCTNGVSYVKLTDEPTGGSYTHTGLTSGTHYYKIAAFYSATDVGESTLTTAVTCVVSCDAPTNLSVTGGNRTAELTWSACSPVPTSYYIYRSTNGTDYSYVTSDAASPYTDSGLDSGTYFYKVKAHYGDEDSGYSNVDSDVVSCVGPTGIGIYTSGVDNLGIVKLGGTGGGESFASPGTWTQCVPTPTQYRIYRAPTEGGPYSFIGTSTTTARTYTDSGLPNGTFFYKITATYSEESDYSSIVSIAVTDSATQYIQFSGGFVMINGEPLQIYDGTQIMATTANFTEGNGYYYIYVSPNDEINTYYGTNYKFRITQSASPTTDELAIYGVTYTTGVLTDGADLNRDLNVISNVGTDVLPAYTGGNYNIKLGDNAAVNKLYVRDSDNAIVTYINSDGTLVLNYISELTAAHGITIDGVTLKDGGALTITGGTNTFDIINGTAQLNIAAGAYLDVNANLTVESASAVNQDLTTDASPTFISPVVSSLYVGVNQVVAARQAAIIHYTPPAAAEDVDTAYKIKTHFTNLGGKFNNLLTYLENHGLIGTP